MTEKELKDTVIVTGWKSAYIAKKNKSKNLMSHVRREITENEILVEYEYDYQLKEQLNGMLLAIFGFAKHLKIDILWYIEQKMMYNELRPYKHGNKKY